MTSDALDLPAMMLSLGSTGQSPLCLLSILHGPRTSLTFDIDPEAPAVLTTRCGHTAFPEPTVPKSQAWHLKLGCSPIWLHNGLGGLKERGEGDKSQTMYIHVAGYTPVWTDEGTEAGSQSLNNRPGYIRAVVRRVRRSCRETRRARGLREQLGSWRWGALLGVTG